MRVFLVLWHHRTYTSLENVQELLFFTHLHNFSSSTVNHEEWFAKIGTYVLYIMYHNITWTMHPSLHHACCYKFRGARWDCMAGAGNLFRTRAKWDIPDQLVGRIDKRKPHNGSARKQNNVMEMAVREQGAKAIIRVLHFGEELFGTVVAAKHGYDALNMSNVFRKIARREGDEAEEGQWRRVVELGLQFIIAL